MNNPVKIIYKYKNNKNRVQYQLYIFIGSLVDDNVVKILNKIQNLNFYDTLIYLTSKDIEILVKHYGEKWYYKLFIFNHIKASINTINNNNQMKNTLITKISRDWVNNHLLITNSNKIIYSYENLIKDIYKKKYRNKNSLIINNKKFIKQVGGENDDEDDENENENVDEDVDENVDENENENEDEN